MTAEEWEIALRKAYKSKKIFIPYNNPIMISLELFNLIKKKRPELIENTTRDICVVKYCRKKRDIQTNIYKYNKQTKELEKQ